MSAVALFVLGLALTDVVFSCTRRHRVASAVGAGSVVVVGVLAGFLDVDHPVVAGAALLVLAGVVAAWGQTVAWGFRVPGRAWVPLLVGGAGLLGGLATAASSPAVTGPLGRWLDGLGVDPDRGLLLLALALAQLVTGNVVVRLVLEASGTASPTGPAPSTLKGGRLLGPMERLLILGLGVAGELGAAGLVIAAKGLLRFPELQEARSPGAAPGAGVHDITEYFLVGSFVSWLVALGSVALLAAA